MPEVEIYPSLWLVLLGVCRRQASTVCVFGPVVVAACMMISRRDHGRIRPQTNEHAHIRIQLRQDDSRIGAFIFWVRFVFFALMVSGPPVMVFADFIVWFYFKKK